MSHFRLITHVRAGGWIVPIALLLLLFPQKTWAHPTIENGMEVVIDRGIVRVEARISMEEVLLVEVDPLAPRSYWPVQVEAHEAYLLKHLRISADGKPLAGKVTSFEAPDGSDNGAAGLKMATYRLEYPLAAPPREISILQDFLREYSNWSVSFVVRIRQSTDDAFQMAMLTRENRFVYGCEWPTAGSAAATQPAATGTRAVGTNVKFGETLRDYTVHGIGHIVGPVSRRGWDWREAGFDHLLFATALVLATRRLLDLVKVVTAFTLAHTITLTLSVLNLVTLSNRVVEPMIAASIVFIAVQNVFWPRQSRGWLRLVVAFGFGLFHGLGFAGGLKEAMSGMPGVGLAAALIGFSLGVEIGHQVVVLPLFGAIALARRRMEDPAKTGLNPDISEPVILNDDRREARGAARLTLVTRWASGIVGVCGAWYFFVALRLA